MDDGGIGPYVRNRCALDLDACRIFGLGTEEEKKIDVELESELISDRSC